MKRPAHTLLVLLLWGCGHAATAQQVQPGLWEIEHDIQVPDKPELNAQLGQMRAMLKDLPPQMRGMLEQQMGQLGLGLTTGTALRVCLSPEDVKGDLIREGRTEGGCTFTRVQRQGSTWRGQVVCTEPSGKGDFVTTLVTPTHYTTQAKITSAQYGRLDLVADVRHVSPDCGELARGTLQRTR